MNQAKQLVTILGSTGSIGESTLQVIATHPSKYQVFALTANSSIDKLFQQCLTFKPRFAVMAHPEAANVLADKLKGHDTTVLSGPKSLLEVASHDEVDSVMAAIVGGAGLESALAAAKSGKKILLANKEALVMAGNLFIETAKQAKSILIPIDSEHNAIFQCLPINENAQFIQNSTLGFEKIVLTASGGPFLNMPIKAMATVTPEQACAHPNWKMGPKISVDSATMLNKALELIEASILFYTEPEKIDILIHPQSIVHSMVHYHDGSVLAQLGNPDMRTPIAYGLAWPERITSNVKPLDLAEIAQLTFYAPDTDKFTCLTLGREAAMKKGSAPIVLNAANEVAVAAFLSGKICFTQIPVIIDAALNQQDIIKTDSLAAILHEDHKAREFASRLVNTIT